MANFMMNRVILAGRLTSDPEVKVTQNNKRVCMFSIAVDRRFANKDGSRNTDFFNIIAWEEKADLIGKYFHKGSSICVIGNLQNRTWQDSTGKKQTATDVVMEDLYFVDSKSENKPIQPQQFEELAPEEDLPF